MHEAKDSRLQKEELALTSMQLDNLGHSASADEDAHGFVFGFCFWVFGFSLERWFSSSPTPLRSNLKAKALSTNTKAVSRMAPRRPRLDQTDCAGFLGRPRRQSPVPFRRGTGSARSSPGRRPALAEGSRGGGAFFWKRAALLLSCKISFQATGPWSPQSTRTEASGPQAFPWKSPDLKRITQLKVPFHYCVGVGGCTEPYVYGWPHPPDCHWVRCFHTKRKFLREKSKVLQPCTVYIY